MRLSSRVWIASVLLACGPARAQSDLTITLTGQSMIRSDLRATAPNAIPRIRRCCRVTSSSRTSRPRSRSRGRRSGRGARISRAARNARCASSRSASTCCRCRTTTRSTCRRPAFENTLREAERRGIVHAGIGNDARLKRRRRPISSRQHDHRAGRRAHLASSPPAAWPRRTAGCQRASGQGGRQRQRGEGRPARRAGQHAEPEDAERILRSIRAGAAARRHRRSSTSTTTCSETSRSPRSSPRAWPNGSSRTSG